MDRRVISTAILLLILEIGWLLIKMGIIDFSTAPAAQHGVASVHESIRDVRVKTKDQLTWGDAVSNHDLNYGDSVLTLKSSSARLRFRDSMEIFIHEDSLVTIDQPSSEYSVVMSLKRGTYSIHTAEATTIVVNGKVIRTKASAKIKIAKLNGQTLITSQDQILVTDLATSRVETLNTNPTDGHEKALIARTPSQEADVSIEESKSDNLSPSEEFAESKDHKKSKAKLIIAKKKAIAKKKTSLPPKIQTPRDDELVTTRIPKTLKELIDDSPIRTARRQKSFLQLEGASLGAISNLDIKHPALSMLGSAYGRWWMNRSLYGEGRVTSKVMSYNEAANDYSPLLVNSHLHKYWFMPQKLLGFIKELGISAFGGAEYYENSRSTSKNIFVKSYLMAEFGTSLRFELFQNWDTGGAIIYGYDVSGKAHRISLQGDLNYQAQENLSLGLGFRGRVYEALTPNGSADGILPFREGYAEVYGSLRFWFDTLKGQ